MIYSAGSGRKIGEAWESKCEFFDYNSKVNLTQEEKLRIIEDHAENDVIKEAAIYKTPLNEWIPPPFDSIFFHAYLVYMACNKENQKLCNWWSAEKTSGGYELQRSEFLSDVATKWKNESRLDGSSGATDIALELKDLPSSGAANVPVTSMGVWLSKWMEATKNCYKWLINKEDPQINVQDRCQSGASPMTVFKIMKEEDGYKYSSNNCKRFVMRVFNEIAECKEWKPIAP